MFNSITIAKNCHTLDSLYTTLKKVKKNVNFFNNRPNNLEIVALYCKI